MPRLGIVGGVDRTMLFLERAAATIGWEIEHHNGHMRGTAAAELSALVDRVELLVICTDVNSHNAVIAARKLAVARGRRHVLTRRLGPGRLVALLSGSSAA